MNLSLKLSLATFAITVLPISASAQAVGGRLAPNSTTLTQRNTASTATRDLAVSALAALDAQIAAEMKVMKRMQQDLELERSRSNSFRPSDKRNWMLSTPSFQALT